MLLLCQYTATRGRWEGPGLLLYGGPFHNLQKYFQNLSWSQYFMWDIVACYYVHFGRDQKSQFISNILPKIVFAMKVLAMCLPYIKNLFQLHNFFFSVDLKILIFLNAALREVFLFLLTLVWAISSIAVWSRKISKNIFRIRSFKDFSMLCQKMFSTA